MSAGEWQIVWFTAWVSALSTVAILPLGLAAAWLLARCHWVDSIENLRAAWSHRRLSSRYAEPRHCVHVARSAGFLGSYVISFAGALGASGLGTSQPAIRTDCPHPGRERWARVPEHHLAAGHARDHWRRHSRICQGPGRIWRDDYGRRQYPWQDFDVVTLHFPIRAARPGC